MKKTILAIAILTASAFANAEYMMKIPLEQSNGGALPTGSITIVQKILIEQPTPPGPAPAPTPVESALMAEQQCFAREEEARSFVANNVEQGVFQYVYFSEMPNDASPPCRVRFSAPKSLYSSFCEGKQSENTARSLAVMNAANANKFAYLMEHAGTCI